MENIGLLVDVNQIHVLEARWLEMLYDNDHIKAFNDFEGRDISSTCQSAKS
jgi:hypothetical protein